MNPNDEQFNERKFCYFKRGSEPFYQKCKECNGHVKDNTVCLDYTCDDNYKISSSPTLAEKMEKYIAKWTSEGFYKTKPVKNNPNQLELELEHK